MYNTSNNGNGVNNFKDLTYMKLGLIRKTMKNVSVMRDNVELL